MYMDVILQNICNRASFVDSETVLHSDRRISEGPNLEAVVRIEAIDCSLSKPLDFLISHATVNHEHLVSYVYLCLANKFEYSNSKKCAYIYLHFYSDYFY